MSTPATDNSFIKRLIFAIIFVIVAIGISFVAPKPEIAWVSALLLLTIYLFAFEIVSVDVAAVTIMVLLGLSGLIAGTDMGAQVGLANQLIDPKHLFDGFAGNAVISIIAVMIIGAGLDKTGIMGQVANFILKVGGNTEKRIIPIISSTVGFISSFMQNVGAAALFLPVVSRISTRTGLPMSRLLMPMGFCAILGGTVTMVGSSPLILLNDLILNSNKVLPEAQQMDTFGLFSVTPIGVALVAAGILYFVILGRFVLPTNKSEGGEGTSTLDYFKDVYGVEYGIHELPIYTGSPLINRNLKEIEREFKVRVVAMCTGEEKPIGPAQDIIIESGTVLGVVASPGTLEKLEEAANSKIRKQMKTFTDSLSASKAGIAEIVIPASSHLIGKTASEVWMRKTYGFAVLAIHRNGETIREGTGVRDL
ncbi:MAG: SLC13 family permease, partial [Gammaproteobacteria bacterium]|nr:SLC13 family permease [Gammaproteobacteria bacterium]